MHRDELAVLVREMLLAGQLIDRAGMPHAISAFGRDGMRDVAIDEWMGASPVYTRRMQRALRFDTRNHWQVAGPEALGDFAFAFER